MRLWHYKLISVLPKKQLVSQWRECIAIKRRWEQNKPDSPLVNYVRNYDTSIFLNYVIDLCEEMDRRKIKFKSKYLNEIMEFDNRTHFEILQHYPEHNNRYLKQCYYNLQEKYDRGIISEDEWEKIWHKCNETVKELM